MTSNMSPTTRDVLNKDIRDPWVPITSIKDASNAIELEMTNSWSSQLSPALELIHLLGLCTIITSTPYFAAMEKETKEDKSIV